MSAKIVFNDGEELRPEEAIVRLAKQVAAMQEQISSLRAENVKLHQRLGVIETSL